MPGRRQRADQHHIDARGDEARFERRLEHVARQPRVLADEHGAALRREHPRRGAREPQREIHRHRVLADVAAHAIGAKVFPAHRSCSVVLSERLAKALAILDRIDRRRHIVCPDDRRAALDGQSRQRHAAREPVARRPTRDDTDHATCATRRRAPDRPGPVNARRLRSRSRLCSRRLAEADPGIDADRIAAQCPRPGMRHASARKSRTSATTSS